MAKETVLAVTWHGSQEMVLLLRKKSMIELSQTARDLLPFDLPAILTLVPMVMMQMHVVLFQETGDSLNERDSVTEKEIVTATEIETGIVIDDLIFVAMTVHG
jgi:hypothetical protein